MLLCSEGQGDTRLLDVGVKTENGFEPQTLALMDEAFWLLRVQTWVPFKHEITAYLRRRTETICRLMCALRGRDRTKEKRNVCHPQATQRTGVKWALLCWSPVCPQSFTISVFVPLHFSNGSPALCWLKLAAWAFWMMLVTTSLHEQKSRTEIDQALSTSHPVSQWAPESKTLCSARRPVCLHCNYPGCSGAMVDTSTRGGFTMEQTNKDAHLCPTVYSKPAGPIVLVTISQTRETSPTGHDKLICIPSYRLLRMCLLVCVYNFLPLY